MLMRTDPFRELDRVAQQVFGTTARPAAMPIDAYRKGDEFVVLFDLPGVDASSIDLTVERNVLTVHAERTRPDRRRRRDVDRRAPAGHVQPPVVPRRHARHRPLGRRLHRRRAAPAGPGQRAGQAAPGRHRRRPTAVRRRSRPTPPSANRDGGPRTGGAASS